MSRSHPVGTWLRAPAAQETEKEAGTHLDAKGSGPGRRGDQELCQSESGHLERSGRFHRGGKEVA